MTHEQTISWIFLATALASQTGPADLSSISNAADYVNRAIPGKKELQTSMAWLISNELVAKDGDKYSLTSKGKLEYNQASKKTSPLLKIWENVEKAVKGLNK